MALDHLVVLAGLDRGDRSVANDAGAVAQVLALHPGRRIACRDSMGRWDELCHDGCAFTGFAPWWPIHARRGSAPRGGAGNSPGGP